MEPALAYKVTIFFGKRKTSNKKGFLLQMIAIYLDCFAGSQ